MDSSSGNLFLKASLDYEDVTSYAVTITVKDPSDLLDTVDLTVNVVDLNDITITAFTGSPLATDGSSTITITGTNLGTVSGTNQVQSLSSHCPFLCRISSSILL